MKELLELPHIPTPNARKIHEFYDKLSYCVQSLESLKQLHTVNGMASMTLEKLPAIRGDLVRNDPEWETWGFTKLTEALKRWTRQNPIKSAKEKPNQVFHTQQNEGKCRCVYCHASNHKPSEGTAVTSIEKRKRILTRKKLCFNCTGPYHRSVKFIRKSSAHRRWGHWITSNFAADAWSALPLSLRDVPTLSQFKRGIKKALF